MKPGEMFRGLRESIVDPIKQDFKQAYWMQRAARERYPVSDAALNFVPYAGVAGAADDYYHEMRKGGGATAAGNAVEMAVNPTTMGAAVRAGTAPTAPQQKGTGIMKRAGLRGAATMDLLKWSLLGSGGASGGGIYAENQRQANQQHGNTPLRDISRQLQEEYRNGK